MIKLPRVIGSGKRLHPLRLSITENIIPLSNATMEVDKAEILPVRTFVELFTVNGSAGIYRTRLPQETHGYDTASIQLDHAISEVGDYMVQDAIKEETTLDLALERIFAHYRGSLWQLASLDAPETVMIDCDYDNVLETMIAIMQQVPNYYLTFNFTTTPWTIDLAEKTQTVTAEGRLSRNIASAVVKRDDKDLCTRVYVRGLPKPSGRESDENAIGYMDADTVSTYGIVEKETGSSGLTQAQATRIAQAYLEAHKHPKLSVEIDAYDLTEITGEPMDTLQIGKLYRLALPDDGLVITDYITQIAWQNIYDDPNRASVTIGEEQDAVLNFLQAQSSSSKSSKRNAKKQDKLDEVFEKNFVKTDEYGAILNQAGMKLDAQGLIVYARDNVNNIGSILDMTAEELHSQIEAGDDGLRSDIQQTATNIMLSVQDTVSDIRSSIEVTADSIRAEVSSANSSIYSAIEQTSTQISLAVGNAKSDLTSYIDVTAAGIELSASAAKSELYSYIDVTASGITIASAAANSTMYSVIETTATNIRTEVSRRAKVFVQINDPALEPETRPTLREGDIWVKASRVRNWNEMASNSWEDASSLDWNKYNGAEQFVWDGINNRWEPVSDKGLMGEWGTRIEQTENNIRLLAQAVDAIDPDALTQASIDVSADAITLAVSTAKSELYSIIKQTATNITQEVNNNIQGVSTYIEQTASSITQAVARKNKVYVQMTDPANTNTVINGDIWIKSSANDNIHPSWTELSSKTWSSQNTTNWREYYEGYWYVRKNDSWQRMNQDADVVEIGTKLEQDERHIALIARDVDQNHVELGSRLEVTATQIRSEVHAAKSTLYSVIQQTSTGILQIVANKESGLYSSILQTSTSILSTVADVQSGLYSSILQTSTSIMTSVKSVTDGLSSAITQTKSKIALVVTEQDGVDVVDSASIVAGINAQTGSYVKIAAKTINLSGYVTANQLSTNWLASKIADISLVNYNTLDGGQIYSSGVYAKNIWFADSDGDPDKDVADAVCELQIIPSGNTYKLQKKNFTDSDWVDVGSFSRATSLSGAWSGSELTITASPQGATYKVGFETTMARGTNLYLYTNGTPTLNPNDSTKVDAPLRIANWASGSPPTITDRYTTTLTINATAAYTAGATDAKALCNYIAPDLTTRYGDNYSGVIYTSGASGTFVKALTGGQYTGIHIPLSENGASSTSTDLKEIPANGIVENGNYKFATGTVGIRYLKVEVPIPSYTRYNLYVASKTTSSDGHHYTLTIGTGWDSPFANEGSYQYLYKKN